MENIIIILVVGLIIGLAAGHIYKEKKRGVKCIGCPGGCSCSGCCGCGTQQESDHAHIHPKTLPKSDDMQR